MLEYDAFLDLCDDAFHDGNFILGILFFLLAFAFFGLPFYFLHVSHRSLRIATLLKALPTSKVRGVFMGLVEVKGTAESAEPLHAYLSGDECVYYSYTVEEHWRRVVVTTSIVNGKAQTNVRVESGWKTIDEGEEMQSFYLRDETGDLLVHPAGAELNLRTTIEMTCFGDHPFYFGKGPAFSIPYSTGERRFIERAILHHAQLYLVGSARERQDCVAAEIVADEDAPLYLISTNSEESVISGRTGRGWFAGLGGLALFVVGALILREVGLEDGGSYDIEMKQALPLYWYLGVGYLLVWTTLWWFSVYNGLVDIKNRAFRGISLIDVELKRRKDLIPRLVEIVESFSRYERITQEELAELRTSFQRLDNGDISARMLVEAYPSLQAEKLFAGLSSELVNTEDRVALAREYCVSIINNYNTRMQVFPVNFVARVFGLKSLTFHP